MSLPDSSISIRTLKLERYRALMTGIYESTQNVFLLLILVRVFQGGPAEKSAVASAAQAGLLLAPLLIFLVRRAKTSVAWSAGILFACASLAMICSSFVSSSTQFAVLATFAVMMSAATTPLFTTVYAHNYSPATRGQNFSQSNVIRIGCSVVFAAGAGWFLSGAIERYKYLLWVVAGCLAISAYLAMRLPGDGRITEMRPMLSCFRYLRSDRVLRETTLAWMFLGFGVLMMVPLRVEYLASGKYGLMLSEGQVALLLSVVPNLARLLSSPIWGRVFDLMDFFKLRILLNWTLVIATVGFFATDSWIALLLSAVVLGVGTSGGEVAWNLWVTKFAPLDRVSDYMAVHVFFTGVRGVLAPPVGFFLAQYLSLQQMSLISALLMLISMLVIARIRS